MEYQAPVPGPVTTISTFPHRAAVYCSFGQGEVIEKNVHTSKKHEKQLTSRSIIVMRSHVVLIGAKIDLIEKTTQPRMIMIGRFL